MEQAQPVPSHCLRIYTVGKALNHDTLENVAIAAGGFTIFNGDGGWVSDMSVFNSLSPTFGQPVDLVREPSVVLEVIVPDDHRSLAQFVETLIRNSARAVGESAIKVTRSEVMSWDVTL